MRKTTKNPLPYKIDATANFQGVDRNTVPEISAKIIVSDSGRPKHHWVLDPMDTPRPIGFRAKHWLIH